MKKLITILLFTISCSSFSRTEQSVSYSPSADIGCSGYIGKNRISCINELLKELEEIKNGDLSIEIVKEERIDEDTVRVTKKIKISKHLSYEARQDVYDPSLAGKIKKFFLISLPSFLIGFVLGITSV